MVFIELPPNYFIENGRKDGHYIDICYRLALNVWLSQRKMTKTYVMILYWKR